MRLLDPSESDRLENAPPAELALALADALVRRSRPELLTIVDEFRAAACDATLDEGARATAAIEADLIARYVDSGVDPLAGFLYMCEVVERANREDAFDGMRALFAVAGGDS